MIAYLATKKQFLDDVPRIEDIIKDSVHKHLNHTPSPAEYNSWRNSLGGAMNHVITRSSVPDNAVIAIEYRVNERKLRIDFLIAGEDGHGKESLVIVELKQWTDIDFSELDDHVKTFVGGGLRNERHPSYQAWSYASHLINTNEYIYENELQVASCAYLHNCPTTAVVSDSRYENYLQTTPVYIKGQYQDLADSIAGKIRVGIGTDLIQRIDASPIRPSKPLAEAIGSMLKGHEEFVLLDDQKTVLETILIKSKKSMTGKKQVIIINGGPGTGKSVISINALSRLSEERLNARYVTPNAAPRAVFKNKLKGVLPMGDVSELFSGSGSYTGLPENSYDVLIVDEAHRLKLRHQYSKGGVNQILDIINASKLSVFFIDEAQKVTWKDIGEIAAIEDFANQSGAEIQKLELTSQFRCGGSDDYIAWLENMLQIGPHQESYFTPEKFEFKIFDNPSELHKAIKEKNAIRNKSRLLAGYCWEWISENDPSKFDITFPAFNFKAKWNLKSHGYDWIINPKSVEEIGCIHTSQGLEVDYVGVIIGDDLVFDGDGLVTNPHARAKGDTSIYGYKKEFKIDPTAANKKADELIRNTYRTLMSRGMKGCYVYFTNKAAENHFRKALENL